MRELVLCSSALLVPSKSTHAPGKGKMSQMLSLSEAAPDQPALSSMKQQFYSSRKLLVLAVSIIALHPPKQTNMGLLFSFLPVPRAERVHTSLT